MDLAAVMTEIDTRLKTITALSVHLGWPGKLARVPAAVQYLPDRINFDETYGRGCDSYEDLMVAVFVSRGTSRQAVNDITPYLAGSGAKSIKAKLDASAAAPYAACSDLQVQWAELDAGAAVGGNQYVAAVFHCKIIGIGA